MKLQTIKEWLHRYEQQLRYEVRNLDIQPYEKIYNNINKYIFIYTIYLIASLIVAAMGVYGANLFFDATGSYWFIGIVSVCGTIYKAIVWITSATLLYFLLMVLIYGLVKEDQSESVECE